MTIRFEKPIGSHADVKELEYIAALHQTGPKIRRDGSVDGKFFLRRMTIIRLKKFGLLFSPVLSAKDVVHFLTSRHGIKVDIDFARTKLMPGLAGTIEDGEEAVFDIAELTSILMISHLRKVAASKDCENNFQKVLNLILTDVTGSASTQILDRHLLKKILNKYGEGDTDPDVINEMLQAAGISDGMDQEFGYEILVRATTGDIQQVYNEWENSRSTHYDDVSMS